MIDTVKALADYFVRFAPAALGMLIAILIGVLLCVTLLYAIYFFFSLPLRRRERVRLFLDVVEMGLKQGQSVEHSIIAASQSNDRMLGRRFHRLAAYLEKGVGFVHALE